MVAAVGIPHAPQGQGAGAIQPLNLAGWCKGGHHSPLAAGQFGHGFPGSSCKGRDEQVSTPGMRRNSPSGNNWLGGDSKLELSGVF